MRTLSGMKDLLSTESYAVGWIVALPIERAAATAQLRQAASINLPFLEERGTKLTVICK